jgi:aspartyl-tRNA(Asn)/glutamyl-tRNA(Gln) amidotransferase subunit C
VNLEPQDLEKLGRLARLKISPQEQAAVLPALQSILSWVGELSNAPTAGVEPMAHPHALALRLRPDIAQALPDREELLKNAPAVAEGLFLVPRVVE